MSYYFQCRACGKPIELAGIPESCPHCGVRAPFLCPQCGRHTSRPFGGVCANCADEAPKGSPKNDSTLTGARAVAIAQRRLLAWFGIGILLNIGMFAAQSANGLSNLFMVAGLVSSIIMVVWAYRLAASLGKPAPWLWVILMLIPVISLISLLVLNSAATQHLGERGFKVGLLGAKVPPP